MTIDLNADVGEGFDADQDLMHVISSANVSTGVYTYAPGAVDEALRSARECGVVVGCHLGYPDPDHFGRRSIAWSLEQAFGSLTSQVIAFRMRCEAVGVVCAYLKPHGALYHDALVEPAIQKALGTVAQLQQLPVLHAPLSPLARIVDPPAMFVEGFAERRYGPDGMLLPRTHPRATIHDATLAAQQAVRLARGLSMDSSGTSRTVPVDSLCVHGDAPHALAVATAVRAGLESAGYTITSFL